MPRPLCERSSEGSTWVNMSKISGSVVRGDADAAVAHRDDHVRAVALDDQRDAPAGLGVLARVAQQVADDLGEPYRVAVQIDGSLREDDRQVVLHGFDERPDGLDGVVHDRGELERLLSKLDLSERDATHVEQVVHEPHHVADLALHHVGAGGDDRGVIAGQAHDPERVADRRERVPQLVRQHREELVLSPVGVGEVGGEAAQLRLEASPLGDVGARWRQELDATRPRL